MKLYDCTVVLHGDRNFEVRKSHVTAAEIVLLRHIHQGKADGVKDIVHVADVARSDATERTRLARIYGDDGPGESESARGVALVRRLFGHDSVPLPNDVVDAGAPDDLLGDDLSALAHEVVTPVSGKLPTARRTPLEAPAKG